VLLTYWLSVVWQVLYLPASARLCSYISTRTEHATQSAFWNGTYRI